MLFQNSPFRDLDRLFETTAAPSFHAMPMDAYRRGDDVWVHLDLPGVAADSLDISVERNVLTVSGERNWQREDGDRIYVSERRRGAFRRQVTLGDGLESDTVEADYSDGVLTLRIPVSAKAQPRKIEIKGAPKAELADAVETTSTDA
jgi:HSP20 family protein